MQSKSYLGIAAAVACAQSAQATIIVDTNSNPSISVSTGVDPDSIPFIEITQSNAASANGIVIVETTSNDPIGKIRVFNDSTSQELTIRVRGENNDFAKRPSEINRIEALSPLSDVILAQCDVVNDVVNRIQVSQVMNADIGGDIPILRVVENSGSSPQPSFVTNVIVGGDLGQLWVASAGCHRLSA